MDGPGGHLGSFQLLAIINKAAMNIVEHVSLLQVGAPSGYIPRSGIAESSSSSMKRQHFQQFMLVLVEISGSWAYIQKMFQLVRRTHALLCS